MFPQAVMNAFIQYTLMWSSLLNCPYDAGEENSKEEKITTLSKTILLYMKETGISNNLQKLAVNVESRLFIHSVIPTEVKSMRANEPQTEKWCDYFICILSVVNTAPTRIWLLF